jgi:hypothetical protein
MTMKNIEDRRRCNMEAMVRQAIRDATTLMLDRAKSHASMAWEMRRARCTGPSADRQEDLAEAWERAAERVNTLAKQ